MCTELHALDALGVPYHHAFCSEIWEPAIRYIRSNHRASVMYRDMTDRELETAPSVDLYVCGFVCCPMSGMNQKKRSDDPRRDLMWHAIAYIKAKRPKCFIMTIELCCALIVVTVRILGGSAAYRALEEARRRQAPLRRRLSVFSTSFFTCALHFEDSRDALQKGALCTSAIEEISLELARSIQVM